MSGLKQIKSNIRSIDKTKKVTKAMEAVSAVKMRKTQKRAVAARPYAVAALRVLERLSGSPSALQHPLLAPRTSLAKRVKVFLITSDKGLAGSLNGGVVKAVVETLRKRSLAKEQVSFVCLGRKGADYFTSRGYRVERTHDNAADTVAVSDIRHFTDTLVAEFLDGNFDECLIAYPSFVSTFEQRPVVRLFLPVSLAALEEVVAGILPKKGAFSDASTGNVAEARGIPYTVEPDPDSVLAELLPMLVNIELAHALFETKASEHSARMVAMKSASDKAGERSKELNRIFNKARQAMITKEVSEITGGIEAMATA